MHGRVPLTDPAIGGNGLVWLGQLFSKHLCDRSRDTLVQLDLVHDVTVALKELDFMAIQAEHLESVSCLKDAHQGLEVEVVRHHRQFGDRTLQPVNLEHILGSQHGQAVVGAVPEFTVIRSDLDGVRRSLRQRPAGATGEQLYQLRPSSCIRCQKALLRPWPVRMAAM